MLNKEERDLLLAELLRIVSLSHCDVELIEDAVDKYTFINCCKPCISYPGCKECEDGVTCDSYRSREK